MPKPQPRRRRFAERELLVRLRKYEELLRQHHVEFKPMHTAKDSESQEPGILAQYDTEPDSPAIEEVVNCSGDSEPA